MLPPPPRIVTLVLVRLDGTVLGETDPFAVSTPWWMDMSPVVDAARDRFGLAVRVVRLLRAEQPAPHGGPVTYLATVSDTSETPADLRLFSGELTHDRFRAPYAELGGIEEDLGWASEQLGNIEAAVQHRTWNLSSIWSLRLADGDTFWLKHVPPFFAHEGVVLSLLTDVLHRRDVPHLIARDGNRFLLADIAGIDRYDADNAERIQMIRQLVSLQATGVSHVDSLISNGLPDWRADALTLALPALISRRASAFAPARAARLERFAASLSSRFAAIDTCGLPDTLLHGDFHSGNVRGNGTQATILDWGDSGVGHPMLDQPAFLRDPGSASNTAALESAWVTAWRAERPGSDPQRAARLLAPVAAARQALVYQGFLDRIEVAERPYHHGDVDDWLTRCAELLTHD